MGLCRVDNAYQAAMDHINSKREEIMKLVSDFPYLHDSHKKEMLDYLETYFVSASGENFINKNLNGTCQ